MDIDKDSFSTSQILSKLWLVETLEKILIDQSIKDPISILTLGGWYGIINLILRIRGNIKIKLVRNLEIDENACYVADQINKAWEWQNWQFKSVYGDANLFDYDNNQFDVIINTSIEHISGKHWFNNIPKNQFVVLQSNNQEHDDHCHTHKSLNEFLLDFPLTEIYYSGEKTFEYPDWKFCRFMIIGRK